MQLSRKVKIVMTGINTVCLIVTLLYPNDVTPFAVLPVIVTATSWIFVDRRDSPHMYLVLISATCIASTSLVVGLTSEMITEPLYSIKFSDGVAFIGGNVLNYGVFAFVIIVYYLLTTVMDIFCTGKVSLEEFYINSLTKSKTKSNR